MNSKILIIKIWGSIFAPKNNKDFNLKYLENLHITLKKIYKWKIIIIHWTWNVWHWFVKNFWINNKTFSKYLKVRNNFFLKMDNIFYKYKRVLARKVNKIGKNIFNNLEENIIIWWDALNKTFEIISSDTIFWKLIWWNKNIEIILTDVDWVLNKQWELFEKINLSKLDDIKFWNKENDVTGSMKWKLLAIKKYIWTNSKWVWLCNWFDLDNLEKIIKTWKWKWTFLVLD